MKKAWFRLLGLLLLAAPTLVQGQSFDVITNSDNTNTVTITNYTGPDGPVTIPTNINGLIVVGIGSQAFYNKSNLTSVTIPGTITNIGDDAFAGCAGLTNVSIPASVTNIGVGIFAGCTNLTAITVDGQNPSYSSTNGVLFDKSQTMLIEYPGGQAGIYAIPGTVTAIGGEAFFASVGLTGITIPGGVTSIGSEAFLACPSLTSVTIPGTVANIGSGAFEGCVTLGNVVILGDVTTIGNSLFNGCVLLTNVVIPGTVTSIGNSAFYACVSLTNLVIPAGVTNIADAAFSGCSSLTNLAIPAGVTSIGSEVFASCSSLSSIIIPNSVTNIGFSSFYDASNLTSVVIPGSVANIGGYAFGNCSSLTNVTIPGSVTNIADFAFTSCSNLTTVSFTGNAPAADLTVFNSDTNVTVSFLPGTTGWGANFAGIPAAPVQGGSLQVTIEPSTAIAAGAQWAVDGGTFQNSGVTVANLTVGSHTVSFSAIGGSTTPPGQTVTITNGVTTEVVGLYVPLVTPTDGLILITNGFGTVQHSKWPNPLVIGKKYTMTATPKTKNVFTGWYGGTNPYTTLSTSTRYTFTMQSNLLLEANFLTNYFLTAQGAYKGLFAPPYALRQQGNSGSFSFNLTSSGAFSGNLVPGGETVPVSGKFDATGAAKVVSKRLHSEPSLTTTLQLDFVNQMISGTVADGAFTAQLNGDRNVFTGKNKATRFAGEYTLVIPGTNDPAVGPSGVSYGKVKVSATGGVTLAGSLADGTAISQSSEVSKDGRWPLYLNLYGGEGSLLAWNYFTNNTITASSQLSWINATNTSKTAVYRSGFTNQAAALTGGIYVPTSTLPADLTATLTGGDLLAAITNGVTLSSSDKIALTNPVDETNKLTLTITKGTGMITGSFANPAEPKQIIKVNGVIVQGQTNAQGYFLGAGHSGTFILADP